LLHGCRAHRARLCVPRTLDLGQAAGESGRARSAGSRRAANVYLG
jgi:hypothetical protein